MKKTLSVLLSVIMAFSAFSVMPFSAFAEDGKYTLCVYCEDRGSTEEERRFTIDINYIGVTNYRTSYDFEGASYIFVRNNLTGAQYCTDGWSNFANPVTLINEKDLSSPGNFEKFYVPSGNHRICLSEGEGDTLKIAYDDYSVFENEYYICGNMTDWGLNTNDEYKLTKVEDGLYKISNVHLTKDSIFKVVSTYNLKNINIWYPTGMDNNYGDNNELTVDGYYDVYFRPEGDSGDGWFYNFIKVELITPAVETYNLYIGGTQITSANMSDVFGDGTVSFDAETNTLTLNNAVLKGTDSISGLYGVINSKLPELNIKLIDNNVIDGEGSNDGIDAAGGCNVNIIGDGSLSINNAYYGTYIGDWETAGGNLTVKDGATVTVTDSSAAGIWVNHDINITDSTVNITRTGTSYNGMVSNTGGTVTVTNSNVSITNPQASLHFGNGDDTAHKLVINSGTVTLTSTEALGIKCEPDSTTGAVNGTIEINGGTLDITSATGGTNITDIAIAKGLGFKEGSALSQSGHIVIEKKNETPAPVPTPAPAPVISPADAALPTEKKTEEVIKKTNTDKKDVAGSDYKRLMLKATTKKKTITLNWKKISGAQGYIIYGAPCGQNMKRLATVNNPKTVKKTFKNLKKGKYYKYMVVAYKKTADGNNRVISKSKSVHCCTDGGKKGNPTGITIKKTKLTVKKGKTVKIKPVLKSKKKVATHIAKFRYESSNTKIATVDKNGKVKGKKKGTVTIYVYAQNGMYKTVKITVK